MLDKSEVYNLIPEGYTAISQNVGSALQQVIQDLGLPEIPGWQQLLNGTGIAPEPINVQRVMTRGAYGKLERIQDRLDGLVEKGFLTADYVTTDKAHALIEEFIVKQRAELEKLNPLSETDLNRIIQLLSKITNAIKQITLPTPAFDDGQRGNAPENLHPVEQFIHHGAYYFAFRDDAHLATWKSYNISAHAWEIFAYIWRGEAKSPAELPENIRNLRGFDEQEDQQAVQELLNRGWLSTTDTDGEYAVTDEGKRIRDKSEAGTDAIFYEAWNVLTDNEIEELNTLLIAFRDELQKTIPQPEGESA